MADSPVERLIDQGLERYGKGDLDGALVAWESALALAPDDARASGYVEYVRGHYDLLRGQGGSEAASELAVPFGLAEIHDSDRYEIEIGETAQRPRVTLEGYLDRVDDGWFLDDDVALPTIARSLPLPAAPESIDQPMTLELEADEPDGAGPDVDTPLPGFAPWSRPPTDEDKTHDFGPARLARMPEFDAPHPFDDPAQTGAPAPPTEATGSGAPPSPSPTTDFDEIAGPHTRERGEKAFADAGAAADDFDFEDPSDQTNELEQSRRLGFVKLSAELGEPAPPQPGSGFASPDASTAELKVRVSKEEVAAAVRPTLEPAARTPDPAADLELPDPAAKKATLDLGSRDTAAPTDEDERTQERGAWAGARSARATSRSTPPRGTSALDHLDIDDGGSRAISPPVIIDDPVMNEPGAFDPAHRSMPTRELPSLKPPPTRNTQEWPPTPTQPAAKTIPRAARTAPPPSSPPPVPPPPVAATPPQPLTNLLADLDTAAPPGESVDDRTRRRINALVERAAAATKAGQHAEAVAACDLALSESPDSAVAQKLIHRSQTAFIAAYQGFLGDLAARPGLAVPMHELQREQLDSRAAFLLSRIDGNLAFEEILDVSGMPRLETLRHLARLIARGILAVR
jgi:hypothetical protein